MKTILLLITIGFLVSCATTAGKKKPEPRTVPVAEEYYTNALALLENGEIAPALDQLIRARSADPESTRIKEKYEETAASLDADVRYVKTPVKRGEAISSPLIFLLTYRAEGAERPVADMAVRFRFINGYGILTSHAATDDMGIAKCYVERIDGFRDSVIIEAVPVLETGDSVERFEGARRRYVFTDISLLDRPQRIFVSYAGERENANVDIRGICRVLEGAFQRNGFTNVECRYEKDVSLLKGALALDERAIAAFGEAGSETFIFVSVRIGFLSQEEVDFFISRAEILVQFVNPATISTVYRDEQSARGAGPTRDGSASQAVRNVLDGIESGIDSYLLELRREHGV